MEHLSRDEITITEIESFAFLGCCVELVGSYRRFGTLLTNYQPTPHILRERIPQLGRSGSVKSRILLKFVLTEFRWEGVDSG
jgi:hypothetical protein